MIYDDPNALSGQYIAVEEYNNSTDDPSTEGGIASDTLTVHKGTYRIQARVIAPTPDDSFYMNISAATTPKINHASNWVMRNNIEPGSNWHWDDVKKSKDQTAGLVAPQLLIFTFQ